MGGGQIRLQSALEGTATPKTHGTPDHPKRPLWQDRQFADELPQPRFDQQTWDRVKDAAGRGELDVRHLRRPERSPER
jgi:hypothetical protein